MPPGPTLDRAG